MMLDFTDTELGQTILALRINQNRIFDMLKTEYKGALKKEAVPTDAEIWAEVRHLQTLSMLLSISRKLEGVA